MNRFKINSLHLFSFYNKSIFCISQNIILSAFLYFFQGGVNKLDGLLPHQKETTAGSASNWDGVTVCFGPIFNVISIDVLNVIDVCIPCRY